MADKHAGGRPVKYKTVDEMQSKINDYFANCDEIGRPYTVLSMCLYLDITRECLGDYLNKDEFSDAIKKAKAKIEAFAEDLLFKGGNPAGIIFNLKNNFKWSDKQEITNTNLNIDATTLSAEDRAARLAELKAKLTADD